ncbi:MAG TPA: hypothetical protein VIL16_22720 [Trebonia sp.]
MSSAPLYDSIGATYTVTRRTEPRIAEQIWARVGPDAEQRAVRSLRDDLGCGRWAERNRDLLDLDVLELDSRLPIA